MVGGARRDGQPAPGDRARAGLVLRRLLREDQPDRRTVLFLGGRGRVVHLEDEDCPLGHLLGSALGEDRRHVARGVGDKEAVADAVEALARLARPADIDDDVVDDLAVARPRLSGLHPHVLLEVGCGDGIHVAETAPL